MKVHHLFLLFPLILVLTACPNDPGPDPVVRRQIDITVQTSNLLRTFTPYTPSHFEMPDGAKLFIKALIYDDNGNLANSYYDMAEDYGATFSFSAAVEATNPTLVVFSYCLVGNASSPEYQAYVISGENTLATLAVTSDNAYSNIKWRVLGGFIDTLDSNVKQLTVGLEPQGGVVYKYWDNIHAHDSEAKAPDSYTFWYHSNDRLRVDNKKFTYDSTLPTSYSYYDSISPADYSYQGVYGVTFMMPGNFKIDASYEVGTTRTYFVEDKYVDVRAGKQYVATIDCSPYTLTFREGTIE